MWNSLIIYCVWYGIICYNNIYVKIVVLVYNNLDGFFFLNLWKIWNLMVLCIFGNLRLRGCIGDFLFGNMSILFIVVFNVVFILGDIF